MQPGQGITRAWSPASREYDVIQYVRCRLSHPICSFATVCSSHGKTVFPSSFRSCVETYTERVEKGKGSCTRTRTRVLTRARARVATERGDDEEARAALALITTRQRSYFTRRSSIIHAVNNAALFRVTLYRSLPSFLPSLLPSFLPLFLSFFLPFLLLPFRFSLFFTPTNASMIVSFFSLVLLPLSFSGPSGGGG